MNDIRKAFCNSAYEQEVEYSRNADVVFVKKEYGNQKNTGHDDKEDGVRGMKQISDSGAKTSERINAEICFGEQRDADSQKTHADDRHDDSARTDFWFGRCSIFFHILLKIAQTVCPCK